jgi:hypothetical protein
MPDQGAVISIGWATHLCEEINFDGKYMGSEIMVEAALLISPDSLTAPKSLSNAACYSLEKTNVVYFPLHGENCYLQTDNPTFVSFFLRGDIYR